MAEEVKGKSSWLKIILVLLIIGGGIWGYKTGAFHKTIVIQQKAVVPVVYVQPVVEYDASTKESEFVGRVEALQSVEIKPQVSGKIAKVCFNEGSIVKEGQVLFEIDPVEYNATVQLRKAELEQAEAVLVAAERYYKRTQSASSKAVSATDRDTAEGNYLTAKAAVSQAKANLILAQIDLGYCKIKSPITGKIGKTYYTKGNYVTPSTESLATVIQMDPIRVTYSLTDREYLDQFDSFKKEGSVFNTRIVLSNGASYTAAGEREFEDNTIDFSTGTIMMNLRFENKEGRLIPGEMVRVYTRNITDEIINVVPQVAVMSDSNGDYVYVINNGVAEQKRITLGRLFGSLREVSGLEVGEEVAVSGIQNLRNETVVEIKR